MKAVELGSIAIKAALEQARVNPKLVDEVIAGNVLSAGQGQGVGRQAAVHACIPVETPAYTLNMICGSGMKAILNGVNSIKAGEADIVVAAGMESMSNAPFVMDGRVRSGHRMGDMSMIDTMLKDGLTDAFEDYHMGITAENIVSSSKSVVKNKMSLPQPVNNGQSTRSSLVTSSKRLFRLKSRRVKAPTV